MKFKKKILFTIIFTLALLLIIGFSYAKFIEIDSEEGNNYNVITGNTITASEETPNFVVTYDKGDNTINTEDIAPNYQQLLKFKISTIYNSTQTIIIKLNAITNTSSGTYGLYSCSETNYNNATLENVSSNCTLISAASDTLPKSKAIKNIHSNNNLTLNASSTNYYVLIIDTLSSSYTFKGFVSIKSYNSNLLVNKILETYTPISDNISSTYVTSGTGINFAAISSLTNGQGLYKNIKNSGSGDTYYFRGGNLCAYTNYASESTSGTYCISARGTWSNYHCSLHDSKTTCQSQGYTYYELNNNIMFAGKAWKIIKINPDETVKMIYNGTSTTATGTSAQISASALNGTRTDNTYLGYMYGASGQGTYALTHTNATNSTIKGVVDTWYSNNLSSYTNKIADTGFCNDRSLYSGGGYGTNTTYYNPYNRLYTNKLPTFNCSQENDLYTVGTNSIGNKKLTYPIGLITLDEASYAGALYNSNNFIYYLQSGSTYWTMSPAGHYSSYTRNWFIHNYGYSNITYVNTSYGVRPVINLKASTLISSGSGTLSDPWIVAT